MGRLWAALVLTASLTGSPAIAGEPILRVEITAGTSPPPWIVDAWTGAGPPLLIAAGIETATLEVGWRPGEAGALRIAASAAPDGPITIDLHGRGWEHPSDRGVRILQQNLAHEIAHLVQYRAGVADGVPRHWHEGMAEALSLRALEESGVWSPAGAKVWRGTLQSRCADALRRGPLAAASGTDAVYGCGFVLCEAALGAGEWADYVAARVAGADHEGALEAAFGRAFLRNRETFLQTDWRLASPRLVIEDLAAGRL